MVEMLRDYKVTHLLSVKWVCSRYFCMLSHSSKHLWGGIEPNLNLLLHRAFSFVLTLGKESDVGHTAGPDFTDSTVAAMFQFGTWDRVSSRLSPLWWLALDLPCPVSPWLLSLAWEEGVGIFSSLIPQRHLAQCSACSSCSENICQ